ncbi:MAG: response regulator [Fuerstiella sp.]
MSIGEKGSSTGLVAAAASLSKRSRFSRLLLVEDNSSLLLTLTALLEGEGFAVTGCTTAAEALHQVQQQEFVIAVVDLRLPDMQGTQLLKRFRALGSRVRVIINTAYGEFESARDAVNSGAFGYLEKAGDPNELVREVHRAHQSHFERYANDREALLAKAQAIAHVGSFEWNVTRDEIIWSDEIFQIFGISRDDFGGSIEDVMRLIHPDDRDGIKAGIAEAMNQGMDTGLEYRIVRPDGSLRTVYAQAEFQKEAEETNRIMVGFVQDITERKQAEDEKRSIEAELRQAQKMDAIGQLASGVAHEFNNLLTVIRGNAELLTNTSGNLLSEQSRGLLSDIERAGSRASALTKQLLSFAREKHGRNVTVFDVRHVVTASKAMLNRLIGSGISLSGIVPSDPALVSADQGEIEQVILNLVLNARDAMPRGGKIIVRTRIVALDDVDVPEGCAAGDFVQLSVTDDGCGMSPETSERIFEPFFTTKDVGKGTGLGLSVVYSDISRSGGFVAVNSTEGVGTVVSVFLPQAPELVVEPPTSPCSILTESLRGDEVILVCDDDDFVRSAMEAILQSVGYAVVAVESAADALAAAESHDQKISLLLTDVTMPGMNGIELRAKIMKRHPDMKVLISSGNAPDGIESGIDFEFLLKGGPPNAVLQRIRQLLDEDKPSSTATN